MRLPATSANLGPGFDSLALALKLYLYVDAWRAERVSIKASGRHAEVCGATEPNLLLETYRAVLAAEGREFVPLRIEVRNEIPLGMGCGSSAAVRLGAVALASHFGGLWWFCRSGLWRRLLRGRCFRRAIRGRMWLRTCSG